MPRKPYQPTSASERISELMLLLRSGSQYRTRREISQVSGLYGPDWDTESNRRKFYRDLDSIRSTGVRISQPDDQQSANDNTASFLIKDEDAFLTELDDLTVDERMAFQLASSLIQLDQDWDVTAVSKIIAGTDADADGANADGANADAAGSSEAAPTRDLSAWQVNMPVTKLLPELVKATAERAEVSFTYGGKERTVKPLGTLYQQGWRYLAALDGETIKTFRIDRIDSEIKTGKPGSFQPQEPINWSKLLPTDHVQLPFGHDFVCVLLVDSQLASQVEQTRGEVIARHPDGSIELEITVHNQRALLVWLYELGRHAQILSPPELVEALKDSLAHLMEAHLMEAHLMEDGAAARGADTAAPEAGDGATQDGAGAPAAGDATPEAAADAREAGGDVGEAGAREAEDTSAGEATKSEQPAAKRTFIDEIALLTAIVPWAFQRDKTTVADVMATFHLSKQDALTLLRPASVYEAKDVEGFADFGFVLLAEDPKDDDKLERLSPSQIVMNFEKTLLLDKSLKLSMREAAGLLLVAHTAMSVPGADPNGAMGTGLAKLRKAFGNKLQLSANIENPPWLAELNAAIKSRQRIRLRYDSHSQGEMLELTVDPLKNLNQNGHWYLLASPVGTSTANTSTRGTSTGDTPTIGIYRTSRIDMVEETGEEFESAFSEDELTFENARQYDETQMVELLVPKAAMKIVERYPAKSISDAGSGESAGGGDGEGRGAGDYVRAVYDLRTPEVLGVMLMKLGPGTEIVNAAELPEDFRTAGATCAQRILDLYSAS